MVMMGKFKFSCALRALYLVLVFVVLFTFFQIHMTRTPSLSTPTDVRLDSKWKEMEDLGSKVKDSVVFLPLKDVRFENNPMEGNTWFMSSVNDTGKDGELKYMEFPSMESNGRVLCIKGRNTIDGSWNSYALAWPRYLPSNAIYMKGSSFVCNSYYIYDNIWHGLSAMMPFVEWYMKDECQLPQRWVLFNKGELRVSVIPWLKELMEATFDGQFQIEDFDGKYDNDDGSMCFEKALVMRHSFRMTVSEETIRVYDLIRCKARMYCNVSSKSEANEKRFKIGMTLLLRNGTRSFTNSSIVIGIFQQACRKVKGCRLVVAYSDNLSFCEHVKLMSVTNILVSPHGAQLTNMLLMDRNSSVMEFLPNGWLEHAGIGQYVHQWMADSSGMRHQGVWRDPRAHDCTNSKNVDLCIKNSFKDRQIGYNGSYFSWWAGKVLDEVSRSNPVSMVGVSGLCGCIL